METRRDMKLLIFGDSDIVVQQQSNIDVHLECFPGKTVESAVEDEIANTLISLSFYLQEDTYDGVLLCWGTNDIKNQRAIRAIVYDIVFLSRIVKSHGIEHIYVVPPPLSTYNAREQLQCILEAEDDLYLLDMNEDIEHTNEKVNKWVDQISVDMYGSV
jgi:hypothetical protein